MSVEQDPHLRRWLEELRRDGSLIIELDTSEDAQQWRAQIRRACRAAGLRVRTGVLADGLNAWAYHVDHVITPAASRAARRALEAIFAGDQPSIPFHELVRQEQRKMLRVIRNGGPPS